MVTTSDLGNSAYQGREHTVVIDGTGNNFTTTPTSQNTDYHVGISNAGSFAYTPRATGRLQVTITIKTSKNTASSTITYKIRMGTGVAPSPNAAATGTLGTGAPQACFATVDGANTGRQVTIIMFFSNLTVGTAYWIDLTASNNGDTNGMNTIDPSVVVEEF